MRIGLFAGTTPDTSFGLKDLVAVVRDAEARGFDTLCLPNIWYGWPGCLRHRRMGRPARSAELMAE